jgi:Fe-S cluster assembly protein SufD
VPKEITGCIVNQNNRIINLTNNKCEIKPNLYIDSYDVEASKSALIGKFSDEEMFYIQSRGIDYNNALKLLITGFLTSDIKNKKIISNINKNIIKYWR